MWESLSHLECDPLRSPSVAQEAPGCLYRHWQNRSYVEEMRGSVGERDPRSRLGGGGRQGCDKDRRWQMQTTWWRRRRRTIIVCMYIHRHRSAMRHSTIIHDTRFLSTKHDAAATNVLARGSFVASHRGPDVAVFVLVCRVCRVVVVPARIDICESMSVKPEEVGDRLDRRGESRRQWASRDDDLLVNSLTVSLRRGNLSGNSSRGRSRECIPGEKKRREEEEKDSRKRKEIPPRDFDSNRS